MNQHKAKGRTLRSREGIGPFRQGPSPESGFVRRRDARARPLTSQAVRVERVPLIAWGSGIAATPCPASASALATSALGDTTFES